MLHRFITSAAAATLMFVTSSAQAATLVSLTRATFQTAIAGATSLGIQDFDGFAPGDLLTSDGTVAYSSSTGTPVVTDAFLTSTNPNGLGRTDIEFFLSTDTATFTFATAITAFAIDVNTFSTGAGSYRALLSNGDDALSIFETFPGTGTGQFIGFVSANPFTTVVISSLGGQAYSLDTLIYGDKSAVTGAVPEPTTWAMLLFGFALTGAALRARRTSRAPSLT